MIHVCEFQTQGQIVKPSWSRFYTIRPLYTIEITLAGFHSIYENLKIQEFH